MSEQLVVNLRKAHSARLWWENQLGMKSKSNPKVPTVHGKEIDGGALAMRLPESPLHADETLLERATRRGLIDVWKPICRVDFNSRVQEYFQGERALKIWDAWCATVFSKQKKETA